jgi:hypothetical protein
MIHPFPKEFVFLVLVGNVKMTMLPVKDHQLGKVPVPNAVGSLFQGRIGFAGKTRRQQAFAALGLNPARYQVRALVGGPEEEGSMFGIPRDMLMLVLPVKIQQLDKKRLPSRNLHGIGLSRAGRPV